jgi:hypothetical protein
LQDCSSGVAINEFQRIRSAVFGSSRNCSFRMGGVWIASPVTYVDCQTPGCRTFQLERGAETPHRRHTPEQPCMTLGSPLVSQGCGAVWCVPPIGRHEYGFCYGAGQAGRNSRCARHRGAQHRLFSFFGCHYSDSLWLSAGWGQFFESVAIQRFASSSVAKLPTWETGPYPVLMATVQRPSLIIFEWNFGFSLIPKIRACIKMVRSQFDPSFETTNC